jgi:hypothetical protein
MSYVWGIAFHGSAAILKGVLWYLAFSFLEICLYIRTRLKACILYKQKLQTCNYFYVVLILRLKKKKANKEIQLPEQTKTWRQFPFQLCVEANAAQIMYNEALFIERTFVHNLEQNLDYHAIMGIFYLRKLWMNVLINRKLFYYKNLVFVSAKICLFDISSLHACLYWFCFKTQ